MSAKPSESQRLANAVSRLLYGVAGWMMIGLGILGIIVQIGYLTSDLSLADPVLTPAVVLISVVLVLLGVFVNPRLRHRLDRRHSLTQFGRIQSVDERVLHAEEGQTKRCVNCGSRLTEGLARRYREEICFAGIPIFTSSENYNHYCVECAATELGVSDTMDGVQARTENGSEKDPQLTTERR
ncbi:hypothetical protein [Halococcus thailandensis]|uniref:DUF8108 domain-containing protein n=1 Tax=Halococcus thailandensis JCM 13552 TaxID=1227457 RepID=M0NGX7_9EURY|nr:hypothetical protein [Halococcus thailandensis]EMA56823.1 hypothetical protein C451_00415 [Halococcus thailandensis JCM 13552]